MDLGRAFRNLDLKALASLSVLSIALAIAIHPLQFALIQALEGYWGVSGLRLRYARPQPATLDSTAPGATSTAAPSDPS